MSAPAKLDLYRNVGSLTEGDVTEALEPGTS